jgi:hypothetical protein
MLDCGMSLESSLTRGFWPYLWFLFDALVAARAGGFRPCSTAWSVRSTLPVFPGFGFHFCMGMEVQFFGPDELQDPRMSRSPQSEER